MIGRQDIFDRAAEWQLRPDVVEKDYVLGWLLAGLAAVPEIRQSWVFKGGTCIKKCYFETYRFSEDLDFSLLPGAAYGPEDPRGLVLRATEAAAQQSGVEFPPALVDARPRRNAQRLETFEIRASYRGPLGPPGALPRVRFDITRQEPVLEAPNEHRPFHPYPDTLPEEAAVLAYSLDELLAEKCRALYERTRPRDLYDVVFLLENAPEGFRLARVRELFARKCEAKELPAPSAAALVARVTSEAELSSEWENMLGHQLPVLPTLGSLLARLSPLLAWIDDTAEIPLPARELPAASVATGEESVAPLGIQYWNVGVPLEALRFAGANRLLVEFTYHGKPRRVEPYSLRRAGTGNLLFYGHELGSHIKAFKVGEMVGLRATSDSFAPRYRIELSTTGRLSIPSTVRRASVAPFGRRSSRTRSDGTQYVLECGFCHRRFHKSRYDTKLGKHKTEDGWPCPSRHGYPVS